MEIQNYPNYLIYQDGKVFSKKRNKYLKPQMNYKGYYKVRLYNSGWEQLSVHRLVAIHYIPNPDNLPIVDHINRIRDDNRVENLRWSTSLENTQNQGTRITNKSGFKNINYVKRDKCWKYKKTINGKRIQKYFDNKIDAICYKYIMILKMKSFWNTYRIIDE